MDSMDAFSRLALLVGGDVVAALRGARVAVFGLGGVGGWCAEALARSCVGRIMLVDFDRVAPSNVNRQIMATSRTVGAFKVDVLAERLREINPAIVLDVRREFYGEENAASFRLQDFDYAIDAIDSLDSKVALVRHALSIPSLTLFSSMGAARKMDPFAIRADDFRKVAGDALARALRQRFRKSGGIPERRFTCVWSPETRQNRTSPDVAAEPRANGTVAHVTAAFGLALAGLVVADVERRYGSARECARG